MCLGIHKFNLHLRYYYAVVLDKDITQKIVLKELKYRIGNLYYLKVKKSFILKL